jgi:hypothetical protein
MSEAHVRIDEGIKRGPRKTRISVPRRRDPITGNVQGIPDGLKPEEVFKRYLTEETTSHIAASYGVSRKTLVAWLRDVDPKGWKRVQLIRAHDLKEQGNETLQAGPEDALSLACAREQVKSAQWELTAIDPDYQPKQHVMVDVDIHVQVDHALTGEAGELLSRIRGAAVQHKGQVIDLISDASQQRETSEK